MTTFWIYFSRNQKKFACGGLLNKTLIPRNLELLSVGSNWPCKTSPWWQAPRKAVKNTGLYWNSLENTLNILEYTGEKKMRYWNFVQYTGKYTGLYWNFLKKTSGHPVKMKYWKLCTVQRPKYVILVQNGAFWPLNDP